jgi:MarR-like DNA-binding transcriptional regulator SgrR of sgrS sRNA
MTASTIYRFLTKAETAEIFRCSTRTIDRWRKEWIEGIHWIRVNKRVLFNERLMQTLLQCALDIQHPNHIREIEIYQRLKR